MDWQETLFLDACVRTGILDSLSRGGAMSAIELSSELSLDLRATAESLSVLWELGHVTRLTPAADVHVTADVRLTHDAKAATIYRLSEKGSDWATGGPERARLLHRANTMRDWTRLETVMRSGKPLAKHPTEGERFELFLGAMDAYGSAMAGEVARQVVAECPEAKTLIDIGGATGAFSLAFAAEGIEVTMVDTPGTIELVGPHLAASGIKTVAADVLDALPPGRYGIAFLSNISHIYGPTENRELMMRVFETLDPNGYVVVRDSIRGASAEAGLVALNMLAHTDSGSTYSFEEYEHWMTAAGFRDIRIVQADRRKGAPESTARELGRADDLPLIIARR